MKNEDNLSGLFYNTGSGHRHPFKQASKVKQTSEGPDAATFPSKAEEDTSCGFKE